MTRPATGLARASALAMTAAAVCCMASAALLARTAAAAGADPAGYTLVRIASAAAVLAAVVRCRRLGLGGSWGGAGLLVLCSVASTAALRTLDAGVGALLFFATAQLAMTGEDMLRGRARDPWSLGGTAAAVVGLALLVGVGAGAVPIAGVLLMVIGGGAWAVYSRLGQTASDPLSATAGNVVRAVPLAALAAAPELHAVDLPLRATAMAVAAGVLATALGGALWYRAVARLTASCAGAAQSMVPVITALAGAALLGEGLGVWDLVATAVVVSGVAMVARGAARPAPEPGRPVRLGPPAHAMETAV